MLCELSLHDQKERGGWYIVLILSISDFPVEPEEFHWGGLRWPHRVGLG